MPSMPLRKLVAATAVEEISGKIDVPVTGIVYDSRDAEPGTLFVAMSGKHTDGARYMRDAVARGAVAVMYGPGPAEIPGSAAGVRVKDPRSALSPIAAEFFGHPSRELKVVGVTGTDGKSSTVWFISQLLEMLGRKAGFLSTVSFRTDQAIVKNPFRQSTPEASEIHGMLREMADIGREFAVVEATSHGLSARMNRLGDVEFDAGVLTNVTHEHLEFHGSFEQYRSDKANLFRALSRGGDKGVRCPRFGVVNAEDPSAPYFREAASPVPVHSYGLRRGADLRAEVTAVDITGSSFIMHGAGGDAATRISIPGPFWVENFLAACLATATILEIDPLSLAPLVPRLTSVLGRMDYVNLGQPFAVIVDYAHTPGAFLKLFPWVRAHTPGKVTAVFGSAGERDRAKRPMQGRAACENCDRVVITDEDPRGEDSMTILEQVAAGCAGRRRGEDLFLVSDRREAIHLALSRAAPGDTVLLLGKGHEGSIIGPNGPAAWDERAEAVAALRALGYTGGPSPA
jgi:UDP-N-acetylmuramoyl-L-alanyl-D-glutamate--2,6-diaminopimelate ligase